ncbi:MAG TPA: transcription antitermination factor NusB [Thermoclostridium caenicola]|uniref:transcription antitermination factor NusB n=1 Tax=Thermoclostridium caenicola TaxID=659425 RepID=UPI00122CB34C|nr:transcription antitermination factor NusB [Thermoclostridium caenicola]HOK42839.1 transcription antitermination factor NusB [Thermoclostridium caenicola]HOL84898.1 transcription antitermination factor NusB [Thermoclostridium caenicola]HOP71749.1 transcription antitermination factor NusB [Thermoclostridium caenicola]HPO77352.1 transcription antitermination factor NusB [Thermoclostridium caenicola]HPU21739.1 transcription antitermination factor NusB [Thermoclostridium caenicola]
MGRRETREHAMKLLYQIQIRKDDLDEQIRTYLEEEQILESVERDYLEDVVKGVVKNQDEIDELISRHARGWTVSRMPKVDLAIMRLSIYEMRYREDIPVNVSINEAVELAKKYCGEQSRTFINGVLGKVWSELSQNAGEPGTHE